jgi:hypothetical protein
LPLPEEAHPGKGKYLFNGLTRRKQIEKDPQKPVLPAIID